MFLLCETPISEAKDVEDYGWALNPERLLKFRVRLWSQRSEIRCRPGELVKLSFAYSKFKISPYIVLLFLKTHILLVMSQLIAL